MTPVPLRSRARARTAALLVAVAGLAALLLPAAPAAATSTCAAPDVAVVVDFRHWPGSTDNGSAGKLVTSCVPHGDGLTGYQLLSRGGFTLAGTQRDGPAFVCRINGLPSATGNPPPRTSEPCALTPPTAAYWSSWHADPGAQTWTYDQLGALSSRSVPGGVQVWLYGATDLRGTRGQPQVSPQSVLPVVAQASEPTPAQTAAGLPPEAASRPATQQPAGASRSPGAPDSTTPSSAPGSTAPASRPSAFSDSSTPGALSPLVDLTSVQRPSGSQDSGTPWATLLTVAVLVVVALGTLTVRRRRT